jgi:hypothetical protein
MRRYCFYFLALCLLGVVGSTPSALALPSYARQTGLPCSGCHYTPPELNAAGRLFKLMGYINRLQNDTIAVPGNARRAPLDMLKSLPLGAWFEASVTDVKTAQPGTQNGTAEFPQDISLFLSGAWTAHVGSFLQVTYDAQDDHFSMDNTDIRFAKTTMLGQKELDWGLTLNNNPTIEDLWNDTPGWGFPFILSDNAPTPAASPFLNGSLAQDVAGIGAYGMYNQRVYAAGALYRSDHIGAAQPNTGTGASVNISGVAPYWRVAWQETGRTNNLEIGAYGMHMSSMPGTVTGPEDAYTDFGPDAQYDRMIGKDELSVRGTYLRENSNLVASLAAGSASQAVHHLNSANANVEYHFGNRFATALGWFSTTGTTDRVLYAPASVAGSANGSPKSRGILAYFGYWPAQNVELAAQYTAYSSFNGASTNYDGSGRDASGNNTLYLLTRFVF